MNSIEKRVNSIKKSQNHYEKFNSIEIFNGKFSETLEKSLSTSTKNISDTAISVSGNVTTVYIV